MADTAETEGSEIDNTSNLYEGLACIVELVSAQSPNGNLLIYMEWSQGDNAADVYPSDATDFDAARMSSDLELVCVLKPAGASDDQVSKNFVVCF